MARHTSAKHGRGKVKPYNSPGHVTDHPAHNLPAPSGGLMDGTQPSGMGMPMSPGAPMGPGPQLGGM
jgi:hypothetical protein